MSVETYVALLRGINVGGRNVKMDRLREIFESLGFSNVETFIASGNVIFVGSGYLQAREVYRNGALITLINVLIFLLATPWILWISSW